MSSSNIQCDVCLEQNLDSWWHCERCIDWDACVECQRSLDLSFEQKIYKGHNPITHRSRMIYHKKKNVAIDLTVDSPYQAFVCNSSSCSSSSSLPSTSLSSSSVSSSLSSVSGPIPPSTQY